MGRPKAQKKNARSVFEAKITAHDLSTSGFVDLPWAASRAAKGKMVKDECGDFREPCRHVVGGGFHVWNSLAEDRCLDKDGESSGKRTDAEDEEQLGEFADGWTRPIRLGFNGEFLAEGND